MSPVRIELTRSEEHRFSACHVCHFRHDDKKPFHKSSVHGEIRTHKRPGLSQSRLPVAPRGQGAGREDRTHLIRLVEPVISQRTSPASWRRETGGVPGLRREGRRAEHDDRARAGSEASTHTQSLVEGGGFTDHLAFQRSPRMTATGLERASCRRHLCRESNPGRRASEARVSSMSQR